MGATSHANLKWFSGNATGSKANGACTIPTPGTFPDLYEANNHIIPILYYIYRFAAKVKSTLDESFFFFFVLIYNTRGKKEEKKAVSFSSTVIINNGDEFTN